MDPASVTGLIAFAGSCCNILAQTVKTIYQAPDEILALHNEITDLRLVLIEYQGQRENSASNHATSANFDETYGACLLKVQSVFGELANLTATLFSERPDGRRRFERHLWLRKKTAVGRVRQQLLSVKQNLRDLLGIRSDVRLNRIEVQLDSLKGILTKDTQTTKDPQPAITSSIPGNDQEATISLMSTTSHIGRPTSSFKTVTLTGYTRSPCNLQCTCTCHLRYKVRNMPLLGPLLGSLFVGYVGQPVAGARCDVLSCSSSAVRALSLTYTFPSWFIQRRVELVMGSNYFGEPEFNVKIRNRREYTSEHSMFQLARAGRVEDMKKRFEGGLASPNDVSMDGGSTAFDVCEVYLMQKLACIC